jgi:hypothetical protein
MGWTAPTLILERAYCLFKFGTAQLINPAQQAPHVGKRRINALPEVRDPVVVQRVAALLQRGVGLDVHLGDEVGTWYALHEEEELLGAVYVDFLVERTRLARFFESCDIDVALQLVIERLELELELCGIGDAETLLCWYLAVVAGYRGASWAIALHVFQSTSRVWLRECRDGVDDVIDSL